MRTINNINSPNFVKIVYAYISNKCYNTLVKTLNEKYLKTKFIFNILILMSNNKL